ncbi:hypothetical protein [Mycobacterium arosiense]|nr:hypothetical protein [Mycobacterium arosiense]
MRRAHGEAHQKLVVDKTMKSQNTFHPSHQELLTRRFRTMTTQ